MFDSDSNLLFKIFRITNQLDLIKLQSGMLSFINLQKNSLIEPVFMLIYNIQMV